MGIPLLWIMKSLWHTQRRLFGTYQFTPEGGTTEAWINNGVIAVSNNSKSVLMQKPHVYIQDNINKYRSESILIKLVLGL